jgi:hypothetical protein
MPFQDALFTRLEAALPADLDVEDIQDASVGLLQEIPVEQLETPDPTVGLSGDSEGLELPALRLPLDETALRELLESGQARAVAREASGDSWLVNSSGPSFGSAGIFQLLADDTSLGQRKIALIKNGPLWRVLENAVRKSVVIPGQLSIEIIFTRQLDEQLITNQRAVAESFADEIESSSESGIRPVITGCWAEGSMHLVNLNLGDVDHKLSEQPCEYVE